MSDFSDGDDPSLCDAMAACADLARQCGARRFNAGEVQDGHEVTIGYYCEAEFIDHGTLTSGTCQTPDAAGMRLAALLIGGVICVCGQPGSVIAGEGCCHWTQAGRRWRSGCAGISVSRGDRWRRLLAAVAAAAPAVPPVTTMTPAGDQYHYLVPTAVDLIPPYDPAAADHYWVIRVAFHVADPAGLHGEPATLDHENMVLHTPLMCHHCARPYGPRESHMRCEGDAR